MGKSQKPLRIEIDEDMYSWPEVQALKEQGHQVHVLAYGEYSPPPDVIFSKHAWYMTEQHRKYLPLALAEARKRRYPTKEKE